MKPFLFDIFKEILAEHIPSTVCEIGTHRAGTALQIIHFLAPLLKEQSRSLTYTGYDVFDFALNNPEFNTSERNGKNGAAYDKSHYRINSLTNKYNNFNFSLIQGLTYETLVKPQVFDFVYIDGGHSYDTVKHDYSMVKDSKVIVFDDLKITGVRKFTEELKSKGIEITEVRTPSKHLWGVIVKQ
jgi:hypothetical protein